MPIGIPLAPFVTSRYPLFVSTLLIATVLGCSTPTAEQTATETPTKGLTKLRGEIIFVELEGGFWGLITTAKTRYRLQHLPRADQRPRRLVEVSGRTLPESPALQQWGTPFAVHQLTVLSADAHSPEKSALTKNQD